MFNLEKNNKYLHEEFISASAAFQRGDYNSAEQVLDQLIQRIKNQSEQSNGVGQLAYRQLSECYANLAICLLSKDLNSQNRIRIGELFQLAIQVDNSNFWVYFNYASYLYHICAYQSAFNNICCSLSCLYLVKSVLSKELQFRSRQVDLGKSIGFCENNLQARFIRLLIQLKQGRWKMALNQVCLMAQTEQHQDLFQKLNNLIKPYTNNSKNISINEQKMLIKQVIDVITALRMIFKQRKLIASLKQSNEKSILKEIDDRITQFNSLLKEVNQLAADASVFHYKTIYKIKQQQNSIHIVSYAINQPSQEKALSQNTPNNDEMYIQATVIGQLNSSKKSLDQQKKEQHHGQSIFELTKSQNCQNSKQLVGQLLSSLVSTQKPQKILTTSIEKNLKEHPEPQYSSMRKKLDIEIIESQIQPLDREDDLLAGCTGFQHHYEQQQDLLLDSMFEIDKPKKHLMTKQTESYFEQPVKELYKSSAVSLYPLNECNKVIELILHSAEFREDCKEKLVGVYSQLQYNSGFADTYKFRSRQVNQNATGVPKIEWGQSLGFIKLSQQPKNMLVKIYKSQPYYYNDKFLGEGEIEVTALGTMKIPLYLNMRGVGIVSVKLNLCQQITSSRGKSNLSSQRSQSQASSQNN